MKIFIVATCIALGGCGLFAGEPERSAHTVPDQAAANVATQAMKCDLGPAFMRPDEQGTVKVQVYEGNPIAALNGSRPLAFVSTLKVNTDGTQRSYHIDDPRGERLAINTILNAMPKRHRTYANFELIRDQNWPSPETWRYLLKGVIEKDARTGKPCVSPDGYLVSKTSDVVVPGGFNRDGDCDQSKWIDALTIPGLVVPKGDNQFYKRHARKRSPVFAASLSQPENRSYGIIGDAGPEFELGEANVAMNRDLNGLSVTETPSNYRDAVRRFQAPKSLVVIFPGADNKVDRPFDAVKARSASEAAFEAWGGERKLQACIAALN